jgi:hypothetical protein
MAEFDDDLPLVDLYDEKLPVVKLKSVKKTVRPKKPTKPAPKQEFFTPLPPAIGEGPKFKFAQGPFRETLQASTPEEMGRMRSLAEAERKGVPSIRPETPQELEETKAIRHEQELYDYYGSLYPIRQGLGKLGTGIAEPFQATYGGAYRAAKGLIKGKSLNQIEEERQREEALRTGDFSQYINRDEGYDPLRFNELIPSAVEQVGQALLLKGKGNRPQEFLGTEPFRGGARVGVRPPMRPAPPPRPVRGLLGEAPPPSPLQLRQRRTIVGFPPAKPPIRPSYSPPSPDRLARLDPGPMMPGSNTVLPAPRQAPETSSRMRPLADMLAMSRGETVSNLSTDDMTFDLLPGLKPGQAPVMITPDWVTEAAAGRQVQGVNVLLKDVPVFKNILITQAPSRQHLSEALFQIEELVKSSKEEGLDSISLKSRTHSEDPTIIPHETFHAGQVEVTKLKPEGVAKSVFEAHDPEWARSHPIIQEIIERSPNIRASIATPGNKRATEDILAAELPTYVAAGQGDYYFHSPTVGVDFLYDYFDHISDVHGLGALDVIQETAKLLPETQEILESARSTYESRKRERQLNAITKSRTEIEGGSYQAGPVRGVSGYETGGAVTRGDQEGVGNLSGAISAVGDKLGRGGTFTVYDHPTDSNLAYRIPSNVDPADVDDSRMVPVPDKYPGVEVGQAVMRDPETHAEIVRKRAGTPAGFTHTETTGDPIEDSRVYANRIKMAADMPQTAYDILAKEMVRLNELGGGVDPKANNLLISPEEGRFNMVDVNDTGGEDPDNNITYMVIPLVGNTYAWQYKGSENLTEYRREIITKATKAAEKAGLPLSETPRDSSLSYSLKLAGMTELPTSGGTAFSTQPPEGIVKAGSPTFSVGDRVSFKDAPTGMGGEVTKIEGNIVEVKWAGGQTQNIPVDRLTKINLPGTAPTQTAVTKPPKREPKRGIPSLPGRLRVKKQNLWANRMGPGDTPGTVKVEFGTGEIAQFNLDDVRDAGGKRIKDPLTYMLVEEPPTDSIPPPAKPPNPALPPGGPYPPLFEETLHVASSKVLAKRFIELLETNQVQKDYTKPPSVQVYEALIEGKLRDDDIENILNDEGVSWEQLAEYAYFTYSRAGSTLQTLSEIEQRHWKRLREENPALFKKVFPASRQINLMLDDLNKTVLGMSLWRRSGRMFQKAVLTQFTTAANNFITATGRVPLDATSTAIGQIMQQVMEGEGTFGERMAKARENAYETFMAGFEAWKALNPKQLADLTRGQIGKEYAGYEEAIAQVEKYFPDIHSKLFARPQEMEVKELKGADKSLADMKLLLNKVETISKRRDLQQRINKLEKRIKREKNILMKIGFRAPEAVYDQLLRPMQFGEFLMRRPRFVARLGLELRDRGIDLGEVLRNSQMSPEDMALMDPDQKVTTFKDLPADAVKAALSDALEFTMALDPSKGPDARVTEEVASKFISLINSLGPLSMMADAMFPKAMYSAAKTFYDYSALPLIFEWGEKGSFSKIFLGKDDIDPITGESYRVNPTSREDYNKFGKAMVGSFLFFLASAFIKYGLIGDEWYQFKTGKKNEKGNPIYVDLRKYVPHARIIQLVSLLDRWHGGRLNDLQFGKEVLDIATGMKRFETDPDAVDTLDSLAEYWAGPEKNPFKMDKILQTGGRYPASLMTPFMNLRSVVAAFDEDENVRKDLRGYGFWGPSFDRIPFFRQKMPDLSLPGYEGRIKISESPTLQQFGAVQLAASPGFMGREFQRMGINIREYFPKDSNPVIDKRQNEIFNFLVKMVGDSFEQDPSYRNAPDDVKAFLWEQQLPDIVSTAREEGLNANPQEAMRRLMIREVPGRFTRKVMGVSKMLEGLRER